MSICGIYKITNQINGKCYIGQSVNIKRRWQEHYKFNSREQDAVIHQAFKSTEQKIFLLKYQKNVPKISQTIQKLNGQLILIVKIQIKDIIAHLAGKELLSAILNFLKNRF